MWRQAGTPARGVDVHYSPEEGQFCPSEVYDFSHVLEGQSVPLQFLCVPSRKNQCPSPHISAQATDDGNLLFVALDWGVSLAEILSKFNPFKVRRNHLHGSTFSAC